MHNELEDVRTGVVPRNIKLPPRTHQLFATNVCIQDRFLLVRWSGNDFPVRIDDDASAWVDPMVDARQIFGLEREVVGDIVRLDDLTTPNHDRASFFGHVTHRR